MTKKSDVLRVPRYIVNDRKDLAVKAKISLPEAFILKEKLLRNDFDIFKKNKKGRDKKSIYEIHIK